MSDHLSRLFQMEVETDSQDSNIKFEDIVGTAATVKLQLPNGQTRYFNGIVSRFVQEQQGNVARYRATLSPWLWLLTRTADCRIFQNQKVPDIIEAIFKERGFKDYKLKLSASYNPREYCVQYRESAFNFVSRLMEEEGIYYFFQHQDGKHILILADSPSAHDTFSGYDTVTYRPAITGQEDQRESVTDWIVEKEIQSGMYVMNDFNFTTPTAPVTGNANITRTHQNADYEIFDYPGGFDTGSNGDAYAKLRIQELQAQYEILRGQSNVRGVATGCKFTLNGHPRSDQNRQYLVIGTSVRAKSGAFESGKTEEGEFFSSSFTAMPAAGQFRSPRSTRRPLIRGPQTATVVGPSGQKIYTDPNGYGMVKVQFPWDRLGKNDENSSCWVRVSQAWASKNWGDMALPHVGDEVIVECLEGNPDRPIITGRVYNANNMPAFGLPDNKDKRVWQDDYGNQLVFDATTGDEHIRLYSPHHNSGLILGRSAAAITNSNSIQGTLGVNVSGTLLSQITGVAGGMIQGVLGTNLSHTLGAICNVNLATQMALNIGSQVSYTKGLNLATTGDDNKICDGSMLMSAQQNINIVGAANHSKNSTALHADECHIELAAGPALKISGASFTKTGKAAFGLANALPAVSTLLMGSVAALAAALTSDADDEAAGAGQISMVTIAGVLEASSLVLMLLTASKLKKFVGEGTTRAKHYKNRVSRVKLFSEKVKVPDLEYSASLESTQGVLLLYHDDAAANIAQLGMDKSKVNLEHYSGNVQIMSGKGKGMITLDQSGNIVISGTSIKINGPVDHNKGAVTISGSATPGKTYLKRQLTEIHKNDESEEKKHNTQNTGKKAGWLTKLFGP